VGLCGWGYELGSQTSRKDALSLDGVTNASVQMSAEANRGWEKPEDAVAAGAKHIWNNYKPHENDKGENVDNREYGFNLKKSTVGDKTLYFVGNILQGPAKNGDRASLSFYLDFHTHTKQSSATRNAISLSGYPSARDRLRPTYYADFQGVGTGGSIYIGNSDSMRRGVVWQFYVVPPGSPEKSREIRW